MRKLLTKKQREAWLDENWRYGVLTFRYSDGVNGNIVKVLDKRGDIIKGVRCTGGGYDMTGPLEHENKETAVQIEREHTNDH
jgi:hypothetical protein